MIRFMKVRVLVFPCGTEVGLEIHNSLKWSNQVELFGANSIPDHGKFVYKNYIEGVPFVDDKNFLRVIKRIIKSKKIDFIFPAHDSVVLKLVQERKNLGCEVITGSLRTAEICRSKKKTYKYFSSLLRVPKVYKEKDKDVQFPVFLKPEVGQGTRGTFKSTSYEDMKYYLKKDPSLMILEYLPGEEYTIDCFTDRYGKLRFVGPRHRARIVNGISVNSYPAKKAKFSKIAKVINERLKLRGVWFFQVKEAENKDLTLMEIAPRVGGTMGLTRNLGVNLPLLAIFDFLEKDVVINERRYRVEVDRALISRFKTILKFKHVYIDLDDTVYLKNKVNPCVIAFLYQCLNEGIKLHLLSRHKSTYKEPVKKALEKMKLNEIFNEVVEVPKNKEKYEYIGGKNAIFIDDSFSERKKVADTLGIPVFDAHEIESLIDWKY